jgi:hypothetical protein
MDEFIAKQQEGARDVQPVDCEAFLKSFQQCFGGGQDIVL